VPDAETVDSDFMSACNINILGMQTRYVLCKVAATNANGALCFNCSRPGILHPCCDPLCLNQGLPSCSNAPWLDPPHSSTLCTQLFSMLDCIGSFPTAIYLKASSQYVNESCVLMHVQAAGVAVASPAKLTAHSSLPSTYAQASVQRASSQKSLFRSVSWADHSDLQEPPHDDSFELTHVTDPMVSHTQKMGSQTALMQLVGLSHSPPVDPVVARSNATAEYGLLSGDLQSRTAKLDAYYEAKQSPVQAALPVAEPLSTSAAFTSDDAAMSGLSVAQRSAMFAALEAKSGARRASTGLPHAASATAATAGSEVVLGPPARRVSLVVPESMRQNKADAFSPGKPGLKSQLSKMMEEVAQARSEVQGLQSQLSVHSRLGQRSGSTASSVAGSDHFLDGV